MVPWVPAVRPRVTEKSAQPSTPHRSDWVHGPRIHHQSGPGNPLTIKNLLDRSLDLCRAAIIREVFKQIKPQDVH
jgi:hypothetical protein